MASRLMTLKDMAQLEARGGMYRLQFAQPRGAAPRGAPRAQPPRGEAPAPAASLYEPVSAADAAAARDPFRFMNVGVPRGYNPEEATRLMAAAAQQSGTNQRLLKESEALDARAAKVISSTAGTLGQAQLREAPAAGGYDLLAAEALNAEELATRIEYYADIVETLQAILEGNSPMPIPKKENPVVFRWRRLGDMFAVDDSPEAFWKFNHIEALTPGGAVAVLFTIGTEKAIAKGIGMLEAMYKEAATELRRYLALEGVSGEKKYGLVGFGRGGIAPYLCRVGSKKRFTELLSFIAPKHTLYVEPFVGSGSFYWQKEPAEKEVINDLDSDIAATFRLIKHADTDLSKYPQNLESNASLTKWFKAHKNSTKDTDKLVFQLIYHCGGWMGKQVNTNTGNVQRSFNPFNKLKHIAEYKERMKNTKVVSEDYAQVIRDNNTKGAFFFLDPPYEDSQGFGYAKGSAAFDFERLRKALDTIKGHWLMTINDSPYIRSVFKGYTINGIIIKGHKANRAGEAPGRRHIGSEDRPELLISNYALPAGWREHTGKRIK